ncbi:hypothetical protein M5689_006709 [Euphorbia peplus]|nr:hypothetical protein M5689_006709 [Euphorbia peplus]
MDETTQSSDKVKGNVEKYKVWTSEESNELLKLMVDAANRGWRDSNGSLSKKYTAPEEVWEDYFKVHSTNRNYRTDTFGDDTDARIDVEEESPVHVSLDDLVFDPHTASFIQNDIQDKHARFKALELLNTRAKKKEFLEMSPEDRLEWIVFKI